MVEVLSGAAAIWQAFASVCLDEIGLDAETVVAGALGPIFVEICLAELEGLAEIEVAKERVDAWRDLLARRWHRATGVTEPV